MRQRHSFQHFIDVPLTIRELAGAEEIGRCRSDANGAYSDGIIDPHRQPVDIDIQGAIAELAFMKHYKLPWTGRLWTREEWALRRGEGDVGSIQIKSVRKATHKLIIPKKHAHMGDYPYVLVSLHKLPIVVLAGWCWGTFVIRDKWWDETLDVPAWAVRRGSLCPMETFKPSHFFALQAR